MPIAQRNWSIAAVLMAAGLSGASCTKAAEQANQRPRAPVTYKQGSCSKKLDRAGLDQSLKLGTQFLLAHQKPEGNFNYEYNWHDKSFTPGDSQVRQAGAAWGLSLIYGDAPSPELKAGIEKSLAFFRGYSVATSDGRRYIKYPGDKRGALGTIALVALTHIEYLRAEGSKLDAATKTQLSTELDEYLRFIVEARRNDGRFHSRYDYETGTPSGKASPYFDGEALLALVKAARYLGRDHLIDIVKEAADAGYQLNNVEARKKDPDSNTTKGYYQWSSMAYFELATSSWSGVEKYGEWLMELAVWMIDTHRTLKRTRNTSYAYEGIIPAYEMAMRRKDGEYVKKFGCTIEKGMAKLTSWQLGHDLANKYIRAKTTSDRLGVGGIQNHRKEPQLRIDVTQHQMHAVVLARRYYWKK